MDWRYNTIWFDQIDAAKVAVFDCAKETPCDFGALEYVTLWRYRQANRSLDSLPISSSVVYLELNLGGTSALTGLSRLRSLRRLELHHCTKLESDIGLAEIAGSIKHLHVSTCSKFTIRGDLLALSNLEVLRLNQCGDLENIDFIHSLPNLIDFRFVGTNVKSGRLAPLLEHKTLRSVGFMDKRHYDLKAQEVDALLAAKRPDPYQEWVQKGQWQTFRYNSSVT